MGTVSDLCFLNPFTLMLENPGGNRSAKNPQANFLPTVKTQ